MDYRNPIIYIPNKKYPIAWWIFYMVAWSINIKRVAKNFYIDGTFHHPKDFSQILIIIIKDIIINEYTQFLYFNES